MASFYASIFLVLLSYLVVTRAQIAPPLAKGLSYNFHCTDCPTLETIVRNYLRKVFKDDIGQAAGLLRIHFHDCFVQGCDASVLLNGSTANPFSEQDSPPNLTLRAQGFIILNELRRLVHQACGQIVSCADITALAARDAVFLSGGPDYQVPLGRRDGLTFATNNATLANLPPPFFTAAQLINFVATKGLDATDLVAISGGHTIGISHCSSFVRRLYPNQDPSMDQTFANNLKRICPALNSNGTTVLDIRSPNVFDNRYYVDLMNRQGLFVSDQDLYTNATTRPIVTSFAINQTLFFKRYVYSIVKMGMMDVTTGTQGEIRADCSRTNSAASLLTTLVDEEGTSAAF